MQLLALVKQTRILKISKLSNTIKLTAALRGTRLEPTGGTDIFLPFYDLPRTKHSPFYWGCPPITLQTPIYCGMFYQKVYSIWYVHTWYISATRHFVDSDKVLAADAARSLNPLFSAWYNNTYSSSSSSSMLYPHHRHCNLYIPRDQGTQGYTKTKLQNHTRTPFRGIDRGGSYYKSR